MNRERIITLSHLCLLILSASAIAYIGIKYALPLLLPFLLAAGMAVAVRRPADFISKKCRLPRGLSRGALALILILAVLGGAIFVLVRLATEAWELFASLSEDGRLDGVADMLLDPFGKLFGDAEFTPELIERLSDAASGLLSEVLSRLASGLTAFVSSVPRILLFIIVTAISAVYFAVDLEAIGAALLSVLPERAARGVRDFKQRFFGVIVRYARSYLLVMLLTFAIMIFGLTIMRRRYALLLAAVISLLDLLPVIGVGTVLIPWSVWMLMTGETGLAIGLAVLFAVNEIARQIAEPKIFGMNLGIHPLLTLVLMYVGYSLLGLFGLLLLPVVSVVISAAVNKYKTADVKE